MPVEVDGEWYSHDRTLLREFNRVKSALLSKYGNGHIDKTDCDYTWMWELIQGHSRGTCKTKDSRGFRLTYRGDIYLTDQNGDHMEDALGNWIKVGKDGLVRNRFRTDDVVPYRQKVFKVMRDLVADQVKQVRVAAGAEGVLA